MPPNVKIRPIVLSNASLAAMSMRAAEQRVGRRCRSLGGPPPTAIDEPCGEVPERLNGRDWKSRNGGNLVRGFESPPLRFFSDPRTLKRVRGLSLEASQDEEDRTPGSRGQ